MQDFGNKRKFALPFKSCVPFGFNFNHEKTSTFSRTFMFRLSLCTNYHHQCRYAIGRLSLSNG